MNKKWLSAGLVAGMIAIPLSPVVADTIEKWTLDQAVETIKANDLSTKITEEDPELSKWALQYQSSFQAYLQDAQDEQALYNDLKTNLQLDNDAYSNLYSYWLIKENEAVQQLNLDLATEELRIVKLKYEQGVASKQELLQAELNLNQAQVSFDEAEMNAANMKQMLNQDLGQEWSAALELDEPDFTYVTEEAYLTNNYLEDLKADYPALVPLDELYQGYHYLLHKKVDDMDEDGHATERIAKDELEEYYEEKVEETRLQIDLTKEAIDLLAHNYENTLPTLEEKVETYKENVAKTEQLYNMAKVSYEQGMSIMNDLEDARYQLQQARLGLVQAKKDYLVEKKNFELFKAGLLGQ